MRRLALASVCLSACGRFGFDEPLGDGSIGDDIVDVVDAAVDAPPLPCARQFCDDFEAGLARWDGREDGGSAEVSSVPGFGRTGGSMRAVSPMTTAVAAVYKDLFQTLPNDIYVRVYLFASSTGEVNLEPVELANVARDHQIVFSVYSESIDIHAHNMAGNFRSDSLTPMPRDRWVCFELHVRFGAAGIVELSLDDAPLISSGVIDTRPPAGGLARVLAGIASKPISVDSEIHVDDVAIDTQPVGCID